jgi:hypothetical protein
MRRLLRYVAVVVGITVIDILADPPHRGTAARVCLLLLAVGGAAALVARLRRSVPDTASDAFEPHPVDEVASAAPTDLRRLEVDVRAVDVAARIHDGRGRVGRLPSHFRAQVLAIAAHRLRRHGLSIDVIADRDAVLALVAPALATAIYDGQGDDAAAIIAGLEAL